MGKGTTNLTMYTSVDFAWLSGLLEGEGSFYTRTPIQGKVGARPEISIGMTDKDVLERAAPLMAGKVYGPYTAGGRKKPIWYVKKTGIGALSLMVSLFATMGERRQAQIQKALSTWEHAI